MRRLAFLVPALFTAACLAPVDSDPTESATNDPSGVIEQAQSLFGVHDAPIGKPELASVDTLFPQAGAWLVNTVYSTDLDWINSTAGATASARQKGYTPVLRVDYARPDGTVYADGGATAGATIPPEGVVDWCLARKPDPNDPQHKVGPSRHVGQGQHLDCYLAYLDDLVGAAGSVHTWVIGNEMNMSAEAKAFPGGKIPPGVYASVFRAARAHIRSKPGHGSDAVFVGGVAPGAAGGPAYTSGKDYYAAVLYALDPKDVDGLALHAYGGWAKPCDNGGMKPLTAFEQGQNGGLGYRSAAQWIDALGYAQKALLITEMSVHTHVTHGPPNAACGKIADGYLYDRAEAAQFIRDAYASIRDWNFGPSNHAILGGVWFTWNDPWSFAEESIKNVSDLMQQGQLGTSSNDNPFYAMRSLANGNGYPAGDPAHFGDCAHGDAGATRTFSEVPYSLKGKLKSYWESTGDLPVFGFPIEDARCQVDASSGRLLWMQYTQRARFEYHAELAGTPYEISLGLLGRPLAQKSGVNPDAWQTSAVSHGGDCQWIGVGGDPSTGHYVCGALLGYWKDHGVKDPSLGPTDRSIKLLGYPVSAEVPFTAKDGKQLTVQWFERARLERHPELGGIVLGGLLGCEALGDPTRPGCQ